MRYWLMKSEPDIFSIKDLREAPGSKAGWDGVRNFQARNFMRDSMRKGDLVLFYHSSCEPPGIVGIAEVSREAYPDPTQFDPKNPYYDKKAKPEKPIWEMVEVRFREEFPHILTLNAIKRHAARLNGLILLNKGNRLSVMPVAEEHFHFLVEQARGSRAND